MARTVAIVGAGRMGEAVARGLIAADVLAPSDIVCVVRRAERADELVAAHGVRATLDAADAVSGADVVLLGLKPQQLIDELTRIGGAIGGDQLVVSMAAGVSTATIERHLPAGTPVVRVMPNTPLLVGRGMSAICAGTHATDDGLALVEQLFATLGVVVVVGEDDLDAVTAVSGSGPAYLFLLAEAMIDAGVAEGLDRSLAETLVVQTLLGAATLLDRERDPAALRAAVSSPGGTTMAALEVFDERGLRAIVGEAVAAAAQRGRELGAA